MEKRRRRPGVAISCWRFLGALVICFRSTARQQLSAARRKWCRRRRRQRQPAWRPGTGRCCRQAAAAAGQPLFHQCSANSVPVRSARRHVQQRSDRSRSRTVGGRFPETRRHVEQPRHSGGRRRGRLVRQGRPVNHRWHLYCKKNEKPARLTKHERPRRLRSKQTPFTTLRPSTPNSLRDTRLRGRIVVRRWFLQYPYLKLRSTMYRWGEGGYHRATSRRYIYFFSLEYVRELRNVILQRFYYEKYNTRNVLYNVDFTAEFSQITSV